MELIGAPSDENFEEFELLRAGLSRKRTCFLFREATWAGGSAVKAMEGLGEGGAVTKRELCETLVTLPSHFRSV